MFITCANKMRVVNAHTQTYCITTRIGELRVAGIAVRGDGGGMEGGETVDTAG